MQVNSMRKNASGEITVNEQAALILSAGKSRRLNVNKCVQFRATAAIKTCSSLGSGKLNGQSGDSVMLASGNASFMRWIRSLALAWA